MPKTPLPLYTAAHIEALRAEKLKNNVDEDARVILENFNNCADSALVQINMPRSFHLYCTQCKATFDGVAKVMSETLLSKGFSIEKYYGLRNGDHHKLYVSWPEVPFGKEIPEEH